MYLPIIYKYLINSGDKVNFFSFAVLMFLNLLSERQRALWNEKWQSASNWSLGIHF